MYVVAVLVGLSNFVRPYCIAMLAANVQGIRTDPCAVCDGTHWGQHHVVKQMGDYMTEFD